MGYFKNLREDIRCVRERDPAARSSLEVMLCYPGFARCAAIGSRIGCGTTI